MFDYLIAGAGFAGSVIAERLARRFHKRVALCDRRPHIGGNAYDHPDSNGILVHKYGPHIFHTNSTAVFTYLSQFTRWRPYEHRVLADVEGKLVPIPINLDTINRLYGLNFASSEEVERFLAERAEPREQIRTSEDLVLSRVGRDLYNKLFRGYTRKQWGLDPSELDSSVAGRIPVRTNRDDRYFSDRYQAMPRDGYTRLFENMLDHPNITLMLGADYRDVRKTIPHCDLIYTGAIDEFFDFRHGKLPYRSLEFRHETIDAPVFQPAAVVNYPSESVPYTRITEFKYLTGQLHRATSIVYEYPRGEGDPYYPIPRPENAGIYKRYLECAKSARGVYFAGRLATYRYYNMDQIVAQALALVREITGEPAWETDNEETAANAGAPR